MRRRGTPTLGLPPFQGRVTRGTAFTGTDERVTKRALFGRSPVRR